MSRVCEITGKKAMVGNHVSFSNKKNKRTFDVNLMRKKFYVAAEDKWITLPKACLEIRQGPSL